MRITVRGVFNDNVRGRQIGLISHFAVRRIPRILPSARSAHRSPVSSRHTDGGSIRIPCLRNPNALVSRQGPSKIRRHRARHLQLRRRRLGCRSIGICADNADRLPCTPLGLVPYAGTSRKRQHLPVGHLLRRRQHGFAVHLGFKLLIGEAPPLREQLPSHLRQCIADLGDIAPEQVQRRPLHHRPIRERNGARGIDEPTLQPSRTRASTRRCAHRGRRSTRTTRRRVRTSKALVRHPRNNAPW